MTVMKPTSPAARRTLTAALACAALLAAGAFGPRSAAAAVAAPTATTGAATGIGTEAATLQGTVQAAEEPDTSCVFEYGTSSSYGLSAPCSQKLGTASAAVAVSVLVSGLQPDTSYDFRLSVRNDFGESQGAAQTFQTLASPPAPPAPNGESPAVGVPAAQCAVLPAARRSECDQASTEPNSGPGGSGAGLYVTFCPRSTAASASRAHAAGTSEAGWPKDECLKMDKGPAGEHHVLVGKRGVHNWLLGGYGSDTLIGGNVGDVIWGDYHPSGGPNDQTATIYAGNGRNVIYADDTHDYVWTGTNPGTVVHAYDRGTSGSIHCGSPKQTIFLSHTSQRHFTLYGCKRISHYSVGY